MKETSKTKTLVISSMLAALIFVFTYLVKIPVPGASGAYMNIGDSIIYSASMLVGAPWAAAAAGIGSMFSDLLYGGGIYIPATLVIKGLMGFVCALLMYKKKPKNDIERKQNEIAEAGANKRAFVRFVLVCILGGAIMVTGYGVFEWVAFGWTYAMGTIVFNLIQWVFGVAAAIALYYPVKMIKAAI